MHALQEEPQSTSSLFIASPEMLLALSGRMTSSGSETFCHMISLSLMDMMPKSSSAWVPPATTNLQETILEHITPKKLGPWQIDLGEVHSTTKVFCSVMMHLCNAWTSDHVGPFSLRETFKILFAAYQNINSLLHLLSVSENL